MHPLRIGHRGAAGHAPENTLLSIETALAIGVDVVEIDVHRSLDGHLIVMHDARVDRTTNGTGYVRDLTLPQLRALRTASGQSVPTLAEVLETVNGRAELMIELKTRNIARDVLQLAAQTAPALPIYIASFLHSELLTVRELSPLTRTIALLDAAPVSPAAFALQARATHAGVAFDSLDPLFADRLHAAGLAIFTYTVDDPRDIARAATLGLDGLISNFPDRLPKNNPVPELS